MATKNFDYSKWDKIELSDDESDLHPNIDKDSWFRLKHRTRLEREEKEDREVKVLETTNAQDGDRLKLIQIKISQINSGTLGEDAEFEDIDSLKIEADELKNIISQRMERIAEIREKRKWNIDNICTVKEEKTIVNTTQSKSLAAKDIPLPPSAEVASPPTPDLVQEDSKSISLNPAPPQIATGKSDTASTVNLPTTIIPTNRIAKGSEPSASIIRERMAIMTYNDFVLKHEQLLESYSEINDLEATKEFLFKYCDILLHEHSQSYMLLSSLEDEMNGKKKRMRLVCRQSQILSHIQELGASMSRDPRDVVLPFFKRIEEKAYFTGFQSAVDEFISKIQKRAIEKRKEMDAERLKEKRAGTAPGPGGLDPFEVLESLPAPLREAFESQDIERLQDVLSSMDPTEAKACMKKCVDSGLWVAKDDSVFEEDDEEEGDRGQPEPNSAGDN